MEEDEWLTATEPNAMLAFLKGRASDRKLRLCGVECCNITSRKKPENGGTDVECVLRLADGADNLEEVRSHWRVEYQPMCYPEQPFEWCSTFSNLAPDRSPSAELDDSFPTTQEIIALLHELFGNPLRRVRFSPEWRTDTALSLARTMYDSREFSAMPILANALQDAGCDSDALLTHLRDAKQTHVRGCWALDLVLGKE